MCRIRGEETPLVEATGAKDDDGVRAGLESLARCERRCHGRTHHGCRTRCLTAPQGCRLLAQAEVLVEEERSGGRFCGDTILTICAGRPRRPVLICQALAN